MMLKAVLLAVLATLVTDASARVPHPKVKDYDELDLPIFNYTLDNGVLEDVLNVSVTYAVSDGYFYPTLGELEEVTGDNWYNLTIPMQYPNSFVVLLSQYGLVKAGENVTQDGFIYAEAGDSKFALKLNVSVSSDGDDDVVVDYFAAEVAAEEIVLKLVENPVEEEDPLDQNQAAKEGFLKKLTEVYSNAIVPYLNQPVQTEEEGSVSLAKVRRHLKRGPLKHLKLPKSLRF
ncbi:unnamed protein product [Bemisia tabaci]|uniref:Uncharacterized protein n=1 Tax=Bemisia tabaci TaxID=7038 RepID=A0A9P0C984_BEMTA|nr:unnamed protein product [Bemisia tabaci]